ncbi:MAG: FecR family protein [Bacteroidales bacterium]
MRQTDKYNPQKFESVRFDIPWAKSKEEIWESAFASLPMPDVAPKTRRFSMSFAYSSVAAVAAIVLMLAFSFVYKKTAVSPIASHLQVELPDGSTVLMNAETSVSYKPLWWYIQREVNLDGEAFFKVKKGKRFAVKSHAATTSVLGTTFNIYARKDGYEATCLTGKVKVEPTTSKEVVVLTPHQKAVVASGHINQQAVAAEQSVAWSRSEFCFTSVELSKVFAEISRQYGVQIDCQTTFEERYTGNFSRKMPIDKVLNLVCLPFGINFTAINQNQYQISK